MRQEFCLNHSSGLNAQNILSRILDQARLTGGLPKPVFLTFLSVAPVYHARVEARPKIMGILDGANIFQSTRPHGARQAMTLSKRIAKKFQSTRPRGARRRNRLGMATVSLFQSTRPRGAQISTRIKTCEIRGAACRMRCGFGQECLTRRFYGLVYPERRNTLCSCRWI